MNKVKKDPVYDDDLLGSRTKTSSRTTKKEGKNKSATSPDYDNADDGFILRGDSL